MRWQDGRESGNVEDRRGLGPVGVGGVGIGGVVIALIGYFVFGINPSDTTAALQQSAPAAQQEQQGRVGAPSDEAGKFVDIISTSTTDVWTKLFADQGQRYTPPAAVVLYDRSTSTGCGTGQSAMGPFYCPRDQKVYLDLSFWQQLETQFGAQGEFARAYVIAHEIGHHVQQLNGQADNAERMGARGADSGSVRLELQADCYAGVWAAHAGAVSNGAIGIDGADVKSGMTAAAAVGDDTLQKETRGQVVPDSFTHGTSAQRVRWFGRGYNGGDPAACDTFNAASL
jgi:predicted metalloprotease